MDSNTGYIITDQNLDMLVNLTGRTSQVLNANKGWVAIYKQNPYPHWILLPKNVAEQLPGFHYADTPLNGLPTRSMEEIVSDRSELNTYYATRLQELNDEMARAKLIAEQTSQEKQSL